MIVFKIKENLILKIKKLSGLSWNHNLRNLKFGYSFVQSLLYYIFWNLGQYYSVAKARL
jgi:hypothetical protein